VRVLRKFRLFLGLTKRELNYPNKRLPNSIVTETRCNLGSYVNIVFALVLASLVDGYSLLLMSRSKKRQLTNALF
jgi:hypothetical protein